MNLVSYVNLLENPNITEEFVLKYHKKYDTLFTKRHYLLKIISQPNISLQFIQTYITKIIFICHELPIKSIGHSRPKFLNRLEIKCLTFGTLLKKG